MAFEKIKQLFSGECETHDLIVTDDKSKMKATHYYACSYEMAKSAVSAIGQSSMGLQLINVNDHFHEILLESKALSFIVLITPMSAYETAIDFKVKVNSVMGGNKAIKKAGEFYNWLNQRLTLKRIGGRQNE